MFTECFIEEVAKAAGKDPLEFRRKLLAKAPKHLGIFNAVAEKAGYGKPLPPAGSAASRSSCRLRQLLRGRGRGVVSATAAGPRCIAS